MLSNVPEVPFFSPDDVYRRVEWANDEPKPRRPTTDPRPEGATAANQRVVGPGEFIYFEVRDFLTEDCTVWVRYPSRFNETIPYRQFEGFLNYHLKMIDQEHFIPFLSDFRRCVVFPNEGVIRRVSSVTSDTTFIPDIGATNLEQAPLG